MLSAKHGHPRSVVKGYRTPLSKPPLEAEIDHLVERRELGACASGRASFGRPRARLAAAISSGMATATGRARRKSFMVSSGLSGSSLARVGSTSWQYRIDAAHQQTRPDRKQPIEAPQLERGLRPRPVGAVHATKRKSLAWRLEALTPASVIVSPLEFEGYHRVPAAVGGEVRSGERGVARIPVRQSGGDLDHVVTRIEAVDRDRAD